MSDIALEQPVQGSAAAGEVVAYTLTLHAGQQYRIDLDDTDGGGFGPELRIYDASRPHTESRGGLNQDAALGFIDARTQPPGTLYFTAQADGTYEIDFSVAQSSGYQLTVHGPQLPQAYSVAPPSGQGSFSGTAANDVIELGTFGQWNVLQNLPPATVSGGSGFDVLVADNIDTNWLNLIGVQKRADGLYLGGQYHPLTLNSTPHFLDDAVVNVKLDSVEAVQFADRVVYTLTPAQAMVARLYEGALGRAPDIAGLAHHLDLLDRGFTMQEIAHGFLASPEYTSVVRAQSIEAFITGVYQDALHRAPEAEGLAFWQAQITHGATLEAVLIGISNSAEAQALWAPVIMQS